MKLCKDCKFSSRHGEQSICGNKNVSFSLVTGKSTEYCLSARSISGKCGPEAIYFEERVE